jgi:hypothetical protein
VGTLRRRKHLPGGARLFLLFPFQSTSEEIERIDFPRISVRTGLNIRLRRRTDLDGWWL